MLPAKKDLGFPPRLAFDLALGVDDIEDVLERYHMTAEQFAALAEVPLFKATYKKYKLEIRERGESFRVKAKIQAEELLDTTWDIIHHPDTPRSVALDAIKSIVKWADLEPKKEDATPANQFNIQINMGA